MAKKKQEQSRILVVVPTLGQRTDLLRQTLESLTEQDERLDIAMIFPQKSLETKQLAVEYGAAMIEDPGSLSSALNAGIASAKPWHEFISWIGDDDLLRPKSLTTTMAALDANPKAVLAFGYCDYIDEQNQVLMTSRAGKLAPWIMYWGPNLVPLPGILFRRSALNKAGDFDPDNKYSMDLEMLLRLHKQGPFINTKQILAAFRWHTSSTTVSNRTAVLKETEQVKRKHLPKYLVPIAPLWERPVRVATRLAARRVNAIAAKTKNR